MTTSLADLLAGATSDEVLATKIALAQSAGFPATSWQDGSVPRTLYELESLAFADLSRLIASIAAGGFLAHAEDGWLDLLGQNLYALQRLEALYTAGKITLTDDSGTGGFSVTDPGQVIVEIAGQQYRNTSIGDLVDGGALILDFEALEPGEAGNMPDGTAVELVTSLPGVSAATTVIPGSTWITSQGRDRERDSEYRERCRARWGELSGGGTALAYASWARAASTEVTRVSVASATGDGTVSVYVAGASGAVSGGALAAVTAYLRDDVRRVQCVWPTAYDATEVPYQLQGQIKIRAAGLEAAQAAIASAVAQFFSALPLGATIYRAPLEAVILAAHPDVLNVLLSNAGELILTPSQIAVPDLSAVVWVTA